jgi:hypothetical protein
VNIHLIFFSLLFSAAKVEPESAEDPLAQSETDSNQPLLENIRYRYRYLYQSMGFVRSTKYDTKQKV